MSYKTYQIEAMLLRSKENYKTAEIANILARQELYAAERDLDIIIEGVSSRDNITYSAVKGWDGVVHLILFKGDLEQALETKFSNAKDLLHRVKAIYGHMLKPHVI